MSDTMMLGVLVFGYLALTYQRPVQPPAPLPSGKNDGRGVTGRNSNDAKASYAQAASDISHDLFGWLAGRPAAPPSSNAEVKTPAS